MLHVSLTIESASTSSAEFAAGQATFGIMEGPSRKLVSYVRMWGTDRCTKYSWHVCVRDITRQGRSTMSFQFHAAELTLFSTTTKYRTSLLWLQYQWCIMWMQCMWDVAKQQRENLQIFPATHCVLSTKDRDNACKATRERERERGILSSDIQNYMSCASQSRQPLIQRQLDWQCRDFGWVLLLICIEIEI